MILPGAAYTEKDGLYVNTEGRVQMAVRAVFPPGQAKEDWAILRALSDALGKRLPYDSLGALRQRIFAQWPRLAEIDALRPESWRVFGARGAVGAEPFAPSVGNFYLTNPICRASETMAECSRAFTDPDLAQAAE